MVRCNIGEECDSCTAKDIKDHAINDDLTMLDRAVEYEKLTLLCKAIMFFLGIKVIDNTIFQSCNKEDIKLFKVLVRADEVDISECPLNRWLKKCETCTPCEYGESKAHNSIKLQDVVSVKVHKGHQPFEKTRDMIFLLWHK